MKKIERSTSQDSEGYYDYRVARSSSPDSKGQIENRFQIIVRHLVEFAPRLELKDPHRQFDWGQRLAIYSKAYRQARGRGEPEAACKECGKATPFKDGEAHHVLPHSRGGKTTVENGEWLCIPCNRAKKDRLPDSG